MPDSMPTTQKTYGLSKSKILSGKQCLKRLYLQVNPPQEYNRDLPLAAFDFGHQIGELARDMFKNGVLVEHDTNPNLAAQETAKLIKDEVHPPLFEATFSHDGVLVRIDILERLAEGYRIVEVKSSTKVKNEHKDDCAVQLWVMEQSGLPVAKVEVAYVNNQFVYKGDGKYEGLLKYEDVTEEVRQLANQVPEWIAVCRQTLEKGDANTNIGPHCNKPYKCEFTSYCQPNTEYPVLSLPNIRNLGYELVKEGIVDIREVPEDRLKNPRHLWIRDVVLKQKPDIKEEVGEILRQLPYPRYYIDFETINFAKPVWPDTRPYEQLPFQWSCHSKASNGNITHNEFLSIDGNPPMREFAETLLDCLEQSGPILIYTGFEITRLKELSKRFPDLSQRIENVLERIFDLEKLVKEYYYHPEMQGKTSIKKVLPTVAPDLTYEDMEVGDGQGAQLAFQEIINTSTTTERRKYLIEKLLEYCRLDTLAMVRISQHLSKS